MKKVAVTIVTHHSGHYIGRCLKSVFAQTGVEVEVVVVDNSSSDDTLARLEPFRNRIRLLHNQTQVGFAAAQNQAIRETRADWILCLNPDVELERDFIARLLEAVEARAHVGVACGKLLRMAPDGRRRIPQLLDSTGIYFTPLLRHLDRGSNQPDAGQYEQLQYVFGATGAAALYRRAMIDDVSVTGEFFDEDFFAYREDADLAWRAQLAGWRCLYVPQAVGKHVRRAFPQNRRQLPDFINRHTTKNRFLMRAKNMGWALYWRMFIPMKLRDLGIVAYCLLRERTSLPAFAWLWRNRKRIWEKRRAVQAQRRISDVELARWFRFRPVSLPAAPAPMRIAIVGTRGVPANYGGFETLAEELGARLAARGHQVTVYGRRPQIQYDQPTYRGMRILLLPTLAWKSFDTVLSTFLSALHVAFSDADLVFLCNVANSPFAWIPRLAGKPVALNVDGLDRRRRKWNWLGRAYLWVCEWLALVTPTAMVTDAQVMQDYYRERYGKWSTHIAYGAEPREAGDGKLTLQHAGLEPGRYVLYVSRLEPENNPELVIRGFEKVSTDWRLAVVGGNAYRPEFVQRLQRTRDPRIVFTGPIYGEGYWHLQRNAGAYVHATEVGGTHPALIEAMACGKPVLYLNTPENVEVARDSGIPFEPSPDDLAQKLERVVGNPKLREELAARAYGRARQHYNWDEIASEYEFLFTRLLHS